MTDERLDLLLDEENHLQCPKCGEHYNHIKRVYTRITPSMDEAGVGGEHPQPIPYQGTEAIFEEIGNGPRRPSLVIEMICEFCPVLGEEGDGVFVDYNWRLVLDQHKGVLTVRREEI